MAVRIITDSACDLSQEYASSRGITVIPLKVRFGDEEFLDGVTITPDAFYERLEKKDVVPKTSQITPYDYSGYFEETVRAGDTAVYIAMSAGVSGSWANACLSAAEYPGKIFVVDSRQFCISEGILAEEAARLRDQGKSAEEIASELERLKDRVHVLSIFDTLEYLKLGGRLSSAAAWVGGILSIKPVITIEEGIVKVMGKVRSIKSGSATLLKTIDKVGGIDWTRPVRLAYTGINPERLKSFIESTKSSYGEKFAEIAISRVGAVIGTYAGPGAYAVAFFHRCES